MSMLVYEGFVTCQKSLVWIYFIGRPNAKGGALLMHPPGELLSGEIFIN